MWAASAVIGAALLVMWMAVATTFGSCAMPDAMSGMQEARVVPPQGGAGGDSDSEGGWRARAQAARDEIRYGSSGDSAPFFAHATAGGQDGTARKRDVATAMNNVKPSHGSPRQQARITTDGGAEEHHGANAYETGNETDRMNDMDGHDMNEAGPQGHDQPPRHEQGRCPDDPVRPTRAPFVKIEQLILMMLLIVLAVSLKRRCQTCQPPRWTETGQGLGWRDRSKTGGSWRDGHRRQLGRRARRAQRPAQMKNWRKRRRSRSVAGPKPTTTTTWRRRTRLTTPWTSARRKKAPKLFSTAGSGPKQTCWPATSADDRQRRQGEPTTRRHHPRRQRGTLRRRRGGQRGLLFIVMTICIVSAQGMKSGDAAITNFGDFSATTTPTTPTSGSADASDIPVAAANYGGSAMAAYHEIDFELEANQDERPPPLKRRRLAPDPNNNDNFDTDGDGNSIKRPAHEADMPAQHAGRGAAAAAADDIVMLAVPVAAPEAQSAFMRYLQRRRMGAAAGSGAAEAAGTQGDHATVLDSPPEQRSPTTWANGSPPSGDMARAARNEIMTQVARPAADEPAVEAKVGSAAPGDAEGGSEDAMETYEDDSLYEDEEMGRWLALVHAAGGEQAETKAGPSRAISPLTEWEDSDNDGNIDFANPCSVRGCKGWIYWPAVQEQGEPTWHCSECRLQDGSLGFEGWPRTEDEARWFRGVHAGQPINRGPTPPPEIIDRHEAQLMDIREDIEFWNHERWAARERRLKPHCEKRGGSRKRSSDNWQRRQDAAGRTSCSLVWRSRTGGRRHSNRSNINLRSCCKSCWLA